MNLSFICYTGTLFLRWNSIAVFLLGFFYIFRAYRWSIHPILFITFIVIIIINIIINSFSFFYILLSSSIYLDTITIAIIFFALFISSAYIWIIFFTIIIIIIIIIPASFFSPVFLTRLLAAISFSTYTLLAPWFCVINDSSPFDRFINMCFWRNFYPLFYVSWVLFNNIYELLDKKDQYLPDLEGKLPSIPSIQVFSWINTWL